MPAARRAAWVGGRVALRAALAALGVDAPDAILATPRGAPLLPPGAVGSVSHKRTIAVALAARARDAARRPSGSTSRRSAPLRAGIAARVLTPDELAELCAADGPARDAAVLLRFSAKEAIYKALDPWVQRFVAFEEAVVGRAPDGTLDARLALARGEGPFSVQVLAIPGVDAAADDLIVVAARIGRAAAEP